MKKLLLFVFLLTAGLVVFAQDSTSRKTKSDRKAEKRQRINAIIKQEEEGNLSFRKQSSFGIELRTNGYGAFYELGKRRSPRFTNIYLLEISEIKERNEEKLGGPENFFSNTFIYGKQNNFYQAKLGFGQQYILGQKGNKNGVAITANVTAGIALGFLKPYYLQIVDTNGKEQSVSYESDSVAYLSGAVLGSTGFTKGWNELKMKPGAFIRGALRFDFGRYNERVQAIEIGMSLEAFASKIPIMIYSEPKQLFFQGHVAFVFGSRK